MKHIINYLFVVFLIFPVLSFAQNRPPVVDVGPDQHIYTYSSSHNNEAYLTGTATDPDNDSIVGWLWTVESAPAGATWALLNPTYQQSYFHADDAGDYVISLVADDGLVWSDPDYVTVHVTEQMPPVAVAIADVTEGKVPLTVQFDGSQSTFDPYSEPIYFSWYFGDYGTASEVSPLHAYSTPGAYTASLHVLDNYGQSDYDFIEIRVTEGCLRVDPVLYYFFGFPPVGSSNPLTVPIKNVCISTPVTVSSVALTPGSDPDYTITITPNFPVILQPGDTEVVEVTFTPSKVYSTEAVLEIASDDADTPLISLYLGNSANRSPITNAGPDQYIKKYEKIQLQGEATDQDNDSIEDWLWIVESSPSGSAPTISDAHSPDPEFTADMPGDYILSLIASDGLRWGKPDYVTIHVTDWPLTTGNNFTVLDQNGDLAYGTNDVMFQWDGSLNNAVGSAAPNAMVSFDQEVAGGVTTIHHVMLYGPGTYTVYTDCAAGMPGCGTGTTMTFTVGAQQVGGHMLLDSTSPAMTDLDLVMVWNLGKTFQPSSLYTGPDDGLTCTPYTVCDGAQNITDRVWSLMSTDSDGDGYNGFPIFEYGIPGYSMNFNLMLPDRDDDGLSDYHESVLGSDPDRMDSDSDGITDGSEISIMGTDPNAPDTDGDGLTDYFEIYVSGSNPDTADSIYTNPPGDMNGDGIINVGDLLLLQKLILSAP